MDHDEPTEWPGDGYDGEVPDLGDPDDTGSGFELGPPDPLDDLDDAGLSDELDGESVGTPTDFGSYLDDAPEIADDVAGVEPGFDPAVHDPVPGTDPDPHWLGDDDMWLADLFPSALEFDPPPEPVDGMPWSDPMLLGDGDLSPVTDPTSGYQGSPPVSDLYTYHGEEPRHGTPDPWTSLVDSDDPATSSLARFWAPGTSG